MQIAALIAPWKASRHGLLNSIPLVDHQTRRANKGGNIQQIARGGTTTITETVMI